MAPSRRLREVKVILRYSLQVYQFAVNGSEVLAEGVGCVMNRVALVLLVSVSLASCATREQSAGTAAGAVGGALIGGPIGLVVGAAAGSVVTAPGAPLGSGWCYAYGANGEVLYHSDGTPRRRHC
jgi:hypothetical protein